MEKVSCSPPGGPVNTSKTFKIINPLVNDCGPVHTRDCLKPIFEMRLNTTRHNYFQADLKTMGKHTFLKIDDRRVIHQGDFHLSTPKADYIMLSGYKCHSKF
jgi:hypothetical protein